MGFINVPEALSPAPREIVYICLFLNIKYSSDNKLIFFSNLANVNVSHSLYYVSQVRIVVKHEHTHTHTHTHELEKAKRSRREGNPSRAMSVEDD